jgi:hypothetical protein
MRGSYLCERSQSIWEDSLLATAHRIEDQKTNWFFSQLLLLDPLQFRPETLVAALAGTIQMHEKVYD